MISPDLPAHEGKAVSVAGGVSRRDALPSVTTPAPQGFRNFLVAPVSDAPPPGVVQSGGPAAQIRPVLRPPGCASAPVVTATGG